MVMDYNTLADLELTPSNDSSGLLFQSLDHTVTEGGRNELRRLFAEPLSSVREVRHRQRVIQNLIPRIAALDVRELGSLIGRVERYAASSYLLISERAIGRSVLRLRYADMLNQLTEGIRALGDLLQLAQVIGDVLEAFPVELVEAHGIAKSIRECVELPVHLQLDRVVRKGSPESSVFGRFDTQIRGNGDVLQRIRALVGALHRFDALRSLAVVSKRKGWNFPEMVESESPVFEAKGLMHPLLPMGVANGISLRAPEQLLYLTGPNMAGKTTFMKTCALAVLFAHAGMAVPAEMVSVSLYDRIFAALTVRDSLAKGESFFLAEVRRIKMLVEYVTSGNRVFAIVDEMFKGTNVLDASDATRLVISGLANVRGSLCIVASHLTGFIGEMENTEKSITFAYFDGDIEEDELRFSYQLKPGVTTRRLGLEILEREGVLRLLGSTSYDGGRVRG